MEFLADLAGRDMADALTTGIDHRHLHRFICHGPFDIYIAEVSAKTARA
jgi:hypothetical protein